MKYFLITGWRPRRTIVFCSWGAEEFSLVGLYEWVEVHFLKQKLYPDGNLASLARDVLTFGALFFQQHVKILHERAVAYLNVDVAVEGNYTLTGQGVPLLQDAIFTVAKKVIMFKVN